MAYTINGLGQVLNRDFVVTANVLNVRKEPNTRSKIVGTLRKGQTVRIFSKSGTWGSTVNGWVSMNYLREASGSGSGSATQTQPQPQGELLSTIDTYQVVSNANVFDRIGGRVIFTLRTGEQFKLAGKNKEGTWGLIEPTRNRQSGWVALNAQVRLVSSVAPRQVKTQNTNQSNLPSWIPDAFRNSIEAATNWLRSQVLRVFGNDEKEVERMIRNLTIQYEAVERLVRNGKVKADSILVQTQREVGDFLAKMKAEAQKLNARDKAGLRGLEALPIAGVVVLVSGLAAGVITLQTIQRMRQVEVQRESELRKFEAYEEFKQKSGGTNRSTFEALLNSTAQPTEPQQAGLFAGLGSGLQNIASIALLGAGGFVVYNLVQQKKAN